jgi:hypothetical protein
MDFVTCSVGNITGKVQIVGFSDCIIDDCDLLTRDTASLEKLFATPRRNVSPSNSSV